MPCERGRPLEARSEREARYQQVADRLRGAIQSGELRPGEALPTEKQLAERYSVSRPTIRAALSLLRTEGLIDSRQGSGAYVRLRRAPRRVPIPRLPDSGGPGGRDSRSIVEAGPTAVWGEIANLLGVEEGAQAFVRRGIVTTPEGEPRELITNYFPLLQKPAQRNPDRMASVISARMPSREEAATLATPPGVPVLAMLLASYDEDGDPIQVMETVWPADRYAIYDEYPSGQPVPTRVLDPEDARHLRTVEEAANRGPDERSNPG
jgi:DNA-binding GntR family transcriptional regulator